jgi:hypothetical protein
LSKNDRIRILVKGIARDKRFIPLCAAYQWSEPKPSYEEFKLKAMQVEMDRNLELTTQATLENALGRSNKSDKVRYGQHNNGGSFHGNAGNKKDAMHRINNSKVTVGKTGGGHNHNNDVRDASGETGKPHTKGECFNCGKKGHYAKDCRSKNKVLNTHTAQDIHEERWQP